MRSAVKTRALAVAGLLGFLGLGCATSSAQEQRRAEAHQYNADEAARNGQYGVAGDEQRQAQASQNSAVMKALDEGKPVARVPIDASPEGRRQQ
jgi:hypothetical protein